MGTNPSATPADFENLILAASLSSPGGVEARLLVARRRETFEQLVREGVTPTPEAIHKRLLILESENPARFNVTSASLQGYSASELLSLANANETAPAPSRRGRKTS